MTARDTLQVTAGTIWTLRISKDLNIYWQRKHVESFRIREYAATAGAAFLLAKISSDECLFIQSVVDGSTGSVSEIDIPGATFDGATLVSAGEDSIILSTIGDDTNPIAPGHAIAYFAEISSTHSVLNEFVIGKSGQSFQFLAVGVYLVDGADVYLGVPGDSTEVTTLKTTHSGAIAWQKRVGTSSPPVVAANEASSRVYLGGTGTIIALNSVDGSLVWAKQIVKVKQVSIITIETFDAATTYSVLIGTQPISQVGTTDATTTATNLKNALAASADPDYFNRTWTSAGNVVTGTANVAGVGFSMTTSVAGGTGTISNATTTPNNAGVAAFSLGQVADAEGIFSTYIADGTVLNKLSAEDGSEIFARRIVGNATNPNQTSILPVHLVDDGARLLLAGKSTAEEADGFGLEDIVVGACASTQETDYELVYEDLTPLEVYRS